jgi:serine/threonine protein kinase, bacterial
LTWLDLNMKKLLLLVSALLLALGSVAFAATARPVAVTCDLTSPLSAANTCSPEITFNYATFGPSRDELAVVSTLFDTSTYPVSQIKHSSLTTSHRSYFGMSKASVTSAPKRLLVNVSSWGNSSSVGISQLLSGGKEISGFPSNLFYLYGPASKYSPNSCTYDASSTLQLPVLVCPSVGVSYKATMALSAVEPSEYQLLNTPITGSLGKLSLLKSSPTYLMGFGVAVNQSFYNALMAQNIKDGLLPSDCVAGDTSYRCQPSIKSAAYASLISKEGSVKGTAGLIPGDLTLLTLNQAISTSATKAASNILFLNNPCGINDVKTKPNSALTPILAAESNILQIKEFANNDDLSVAIATGPNYQIGLIPVFKYKDPFHPVGSFLKLGGESPIYDPNGVEAWGIRTTQANGWNQLATTAFLVRLAKEDPTINLLAEAYQSALQNSTLSSVWGFAYLDGAPDSPSNPKQANVRRVKNTNCSPLVNVRANSANPNNASSNQNTPSTSNSYTVGGTVSGLPYAQSITLLNNGSDTLTLFTNGTFTFGGKLQANSLYSVSVSNQPSGYFCSIQNSARTVQNANVNDVQVVCTGTNAGYYVSGNLSGLDAGQTITLSNNGNDPITLSANGAFNFTKPIPAGTTYSVSIQQEPNYKLCKVSQGSGTSQSNVNNVSVECLTPMVTTLDWKVTTVSADSKGPLGSTNLVGPYGVAVDSSGNLFVADALNHLIQKITPSGVVTTLAGSGVPGSANGTGSAASFYFPTGVALDSSGNVFVADRENALIRKITPAGLVTTFAGPYGTDGYRIFYKNSIAVDLSGNVYVADNINNLILKYTSAGAVSILAGSGVYGNTNGTGTAASFANPWGVAVDSSGNVYVADRSNHLIRKISPDGFVTTHGNTNGTGTAASFTNPLGVAVDSSGNVYVADERAIIRKITPAGVVTSIAGDGYWYGRAIDGRGAASSFNYTYGVAVDSSGNVYVSDKGNKLIRKITFVKP